MNLDDFEDERMRSLPKQCGSSLEAGRNKKMDSTLEPPERNADLSPPSVGDCVECLNYRTVR